MDKPVGGRGKKAPYETTHVRVPVDLKPQIEEMVKQYRENDCNADKVGFVAEGEDKEDKVKEFAKMLVMEMKDSGLIITKEVTRAEDKEDILPLEDAINLAKYALSRKGNRKKDLTEVLSAIYQKEISL